MDEEARQNERVKKYQITIAQSMQLGTDIQQVLGNEKNYRLGDKRMAVYLCFGWNVSRAAYKHDRE